MFRYESNLDYEQVPGTINVLLEFDCTLENKTIYIYIYIYIVLITFFCFNK